MSAADHMREYVAAAVLLEDPTITLTAGELLKWADELDASRDLLRRLVDGADSAIFAVDWLDVTDELVAEARNLLGA